MLNGCVCTCFAVSLSSFAPNRKFCFSLLCKTRTIFIDCFSLLCETRTSFIDWPLIWLNQPVVLVRPSATDGASFNLTFCQFCPVKSINPGCTLTRHALSNFSILSIFLLGVRCRVLCCDSTGPHEEWAHRLTPGGCKALRWLARNAVLALVFLPNTDEASIQWRHPLLIP